MNSAQSSSIVRSRPPRWAKSVGVVFDGANDPVVTDVEDVDAARRLLEVAEHRAAADQRVREDRAVDAAVEHRQDGVPPRIGYEAVDRRQDTVEQRADRLTAQEPGVLGHDVAPGLDERALELVLRDVAETARLDLAQVGPRLRLGVGGDDPRGLDGAQKAACDHAVELDPGEQLGRRARLLSPFLGERDGLGLHRPPVLEVRHLPVAHQVDPTAAHS